MIPSRRSLLTGLAALLAAPAIVRVSSIMPVKAFVGDGVALLATPHPIMDLVAGAQIYAGDLIVMRGGRFHPMRPGEVCVGVATGNCPDGTVMNGRYMHVYEVLNVVQTG